jgi:uncharacterized LabA/DUF88 family protein
VDIKIGLDDQIILVSYDSDFVSAAKAVTKGGIGFVLDSMWNSVSDDLHEYIDGFSSTCENPTKPFSGGSYPYII